MFSPFPITSGSAPDLAGENFFPNIRLFLFNHRACFVPPIEELSAGSGLPLNSSTARKTLRQRCWRPMERLSLRTANVASGIPILSRWKLLRRPGKERAGMKGASRKSRDYMVSPMRVALPRPRSSSPENEPLWFLHRTKPNRKIRLNLET